jgi:hypothetical protein
MIYSRSIEKPIFDFFSSFGSSYSYSNIDKTQDKGTVGYIPPFYRFRDYAQKQINASYNALLLRWIKGCKKGCTINAKRSNYRGEYFYRMKAV